MSEMTKALLQVLLYLTIRTVVLIGFSYGLYKWLEGLVV